jgi:hypothetical protein
MSMTLLSSPSGISIYINTGTLGIRESKSDRVLGIIRLISGKNSIDLYF